MRLLVGEGDLTYKCVHTPDLQSGSFTFGYLPVSIHVAQCAHVNLIFACCLYGMYCACDLGFLRLNENNTITYIVTHNTDTRTNAKITIRCTMLAWYTATWQPGFVMTRMTYGGYAIVMLVHVRHTLWWICESISTYVVWQIL